VSVRALLGRAGRFVVIGLALAAAAAVPEAQADTVQSQLTYQAYNLFQGFEPATFNKCTLSEQVYISRPAAPGNYPVLVYLHGTLGDYGGNQEGQAIVQLAAEQGFLGAAFTYSDITPTQQSIDGQANCMFNVNSPGNALAQVCALPRADCSHGFLVSGFSAGGAIAVRAKNINEAVDAAWVMGVNGPAVAAALAAPAGTRALPNDLLRMNIGQTDLNVTDPNTNQTTLDFSKLAAMTGTSCQTFDCLTPDGSGYYVVQDSEVADGVADHCYWQRVNTFAPTNSCTYTLTPTTLDPGFMPPSDAPWSITANLAWLRAKLSASPPAPPGTVAPLPPSIPPAGQPTSAVSPGSTTKATSTKQHRPARRVLWHNRSHRPLDRWLGRVR
jgi:hypothetical protein